MERREPPMYEQEPKDTKISNLINDETKYQGQFLVLYIVSWDGGTLMCPALNAVVQNKC